MRLINFNLAWAIPLTIAIAAMWGVSACANWYAGSSFGDGTVLFFSITSEQGLSVASLSADIIKTGMLFAVAAALAVRNYRVAAITGSIWIACTMWSLFSATGFVAINQGNVSDTRGKTAAEWSQLQKQIVRLEQRRDEVTAHRPQKAVQAEIDGILRIPGVDGCAVINGPVTREHCPRLTSLRQELAHAESALWLDSELERLRKEQQSAPRVTSENPWAELVSGLTTASASQVMTGRALWFAGMLELISGPGLWALWAAYAATLRRPIAPAIIPRKPYTPSLTLPVKTAAPTVTETPEPPAPTPAPDDGGTPVSEPESKPDGSEQSPQNVVNLYEPAVSKRDEKRRKKEIIDRQNRALVSAYVDERLDTEAPSAQITLTAKGGHCQGGTAGSDIYADFRRWCRDGGENPVGKSHFGRFVGEFVDRARNSKGVVYGAVIRQAAAKRRAA